MFFIIMLISASMFAANFSNISKPAYKKNELLVKFKQGISTNEQTAFVKAKGGNLGKKIGNTDYKLVKLNDKQDVMQTVSLYKNNQNVESVQPNYIYKAFATPDDTQYSSLWGLNNSSGMPALWDKITDCSSITIAVVDTGVNYNQEDLVGNMWTGNAFHGDDFVGDINGDDPMDLNGHGTHVAGIIGAVGNNATGITGVCWKASIMAVRVLDATGSGTTSDVIEGITYAVNNGAFVINMSLGGYTYDAAYHDIIEASRPYGVLFVVAAGNETTNVDSTPSYPCAFNLDNILCVGAVNSSSALASFSNYGTTNVDVAAPGVDITSTYNGIETEEVEDFSGDWTTTGGWNDNNTQTYDSSSYHAMTNPTNFNESATYATNANDNAYKDFGALISSTLAESVVLSFYLRMDVPDSGDYFKIYYDDSANPFSGSLLNTTWHYGETGNDYYGFTYELTACVGQTSCTVGFQLTADSDANVGYGASIIAFSVISHNVTVTDEYKTMNGTSMATPYAAGLAAAIFAKEPYYTYSEVINAIKYGGTYVSGLRNYIASSRVINGIGSYKYISTPSGVAASVIATNVE